MSNIDPRNWTGLVPAAGRGSRLGFDLPKILFPVAGRPMLDWIVDFLTPTCSRLVFVLSPSGVEPVSAALNRLGVDYEIAVQTTPTGMGDAVAIGLARVVTPQVGIVWGDQAALRPESVIKCQHLHESGAGADATVPTVMRAAPYIHFERDARGRINGLKQAREGDAMPAMGESDTGFFCFRTRVLRKLLDELRMEGSVGRATREFNMLPAIPLAARIGRVLTPHVVTPEETIGVNSAEDAEVVERILMERAGAAAIPLTKVA